MPFRIQGIDPGQFSHLYGLTDADLASVGAKRYVVDANPAFRIASKFATWRSASGRSC